MQLVDKRTFSPATELLREHGYFTSQIAKAANRHANYVSDMLRGKKVWSERFTEALIDVLADKPELFDELKDLCRESRRKYLQKQIDELDAS